MLAMLSYISKLYYIKKKKKKSLSISLNLESVLSDLTCRVRQMFQLTEGQIVILPTSKFFP